MWPTLDCPGAPAPLTPADVLGPRPRPAPGEYGDLALEHYRLWAFPPAALAVVATVVPGSSKARGSWPMPCSVRRGKSGEGSHRWRGMLNPRVYSVMMATLSPEEKKAYERETRGRRGDS